MSPPKQKNRAKHQITVQCPVNIKVILYLQYPLGGRQYYFVLIVTACFLVVIGVVLLITGF